MSLKELEQAANLSPNSIFRWADSMPAADKLARVASVLDTTSEELLHKQEGGEDE